LFIGTFLEHIFMYIKLEKTVKLTYAHKYKAIKFKLAVITF